MFAKLKNGSALCLQDFKRINSGAVVPPVNELWSDVEEWLETGNEWLPEPAQKPAVPQSISARQARLALLKLNKLADVNAAIQSMPSPGKELAQIEWEYASSIERQNPVVIALGAALGLSEDGINSLFIQGSQL